MPLDTLPLRALAPPLLLALLGACAIPASDTSRSPREERAAPVSRAPEARQCMAELGESGAQFTPLPDRYTGEGCSTLGTVQLRALATDAASLAVTNLGPVTCPVTTAFAAWARFGVDRAAQVHFGVPLASIETFGSYSCRNVAGTSRRSAHATAQAIDIAAFVLADGRRVPVERGWQGSRAERDFLRAVHASACRRFATVLGPDYNAAHRDHLHLEGVIGQKSYCR